MKKKKPRRSRDPKIEPPPRKLVKVTFEIPIDELRAIDEEVRAGGYASRDEFMRAATAEGLRSYRKKKL